MLRNRRILMIALVVDVSFVLGDIGMAGLRAQVPNAREVHSASPPDALRPASAQDFERWRTQIRQALFIDDPLPTLAPRH